VGACSTCTTNAAAPSGSAQPLQGAGVGGAASAHARQHLVHVAQHLLHVEADLSKGAFARVGKVQVRGEPWTAPRVVERELALKAGYAYCDATEAFQVTYEIPPARLAPGVYRNLSGNSALALGFVAAAQKAGIPLFQGSYPITPASDILHELSLFKEFGVVTFQAEDEIAAITSAIGAAYAGLLAITTTSGPGMSLKTEAIGLATMVELPLVISDHADWPELLDTIEATGAPVVQVNTGAGCHLDADMVHQALHQMEPAENSLLFIENGFHVLDEPDARGVDKTYIFHVQGKVGLAPGQGFLEKFAHIGEGLYRKIAGKVEKDEITVNAGGYVH